MRNKKGFTLFELIIALAVLTAILSIVIFSIIKRLDRIAAEKESADIKSLAAAFKESVKRARYIPDQTDWASMVASHLGWPPGRVTVNERYHPRILLIDPTMQVGTNNVSGPLLPYAQTNTGSLVINGTKTTGAVNPRFMIISTIGNALPSTLVSGLGAASGALAFTNLWSTPEGAVPTGWSWSTGSDLKIERIDLSDLFVKVTLFNVDTNAAHEAKWGVEDSTLLVMGIPPTNSATSFESYFLKGSEFKLYRSIPSVATNALEYSEILYTNQEFTYDLGSWQAKPFLGRTVAANGKVLQRAMDLFLKAPLNPYAKSGATQQHVHDAMTQYMIAFIAWRDAGYVGESCPGPVANNAYTSALSAARANLTTASVNLINP